MCGGFAVSADIMFNLFCIYSFVSELVSWPSGLAYRTQVLVLAAECGFESRPWHLCPWARHLIIIASLHPGVKWVPVRAELVDMRCNGSNWAVYSPGSWDGFRNDLWALWAWVIMRLEHHLVGGYVRYISPHIIIIINYLLLMVAHLFPFTPFCLWYVVSPDKGRVSLEACVSQSALLSEQTLKFGDINKSCSWLKTLVFPIFEYFSAFSIFKSTFWLSFHIKTSCKHHGLSSGKLCTNT